MSRANSSTAILLFVRSAYEEVREKDLFPKVGYYGQLKLTFRLNQNARRIAARTPFPLFVIAGEAQRGHSFAERFTNAIQDVFDQGFTNVISIGNDCLNLNPKHIVEAGNELKNHKLVLGPTADGGAYLIGLNKSFFQKEVFSLLPWQQKDLFSAFQSWASRTGNSIGLLQKHTDVDNANSLKKVISKLSKSLRVQWLQLLGCLCIKHHEQFLTYHFITFTNLRLWRGPPVYPVL